MSIFGGGFNIGGLASSVIGGMMGGPIGMLVAQLAQQVLSSVVDQVIDQLPIDQGFKDLLQAGFHAGMGDVGGALENINEAIEAFGQAAGGSASDIADMQRSANEFRDVVTQLMQTIIESANDTEDGSAVAGTKGGNKSTSGGGNPTGAPGWLYALAEVMGKKLDETAHEMQELAEKVDKEDPSTATDFQVASQQFSILMNTAATALKAIGEGMVAAARKQ